MSPTADLMNVIRHLGVPTRDVLGDPELLDSYARGHDQAAFATLVRRYGPMVLGVARRQIADHHRAEDVFQATFLALARSAEKLGGRPVLANWLYTVALRHARARAIRCEALDVTALPRVRDGGDPLAEITARELLQAIDEELTRLPEYLRVPVLLCYVQGMSREQVAHRLGCSVGVVKGRLDRGRRRLAAGLAVRGLSPSALLLAPLAAVTVPTDLIARTVEQSASPWSQTVPAAVTDLTSTAAPPALLMRMVLAGCVLAAGLAGLVVASAPANPVGQPPVTTITVTAPVPATNPIPEDPLPASATVRFGTSRYRHPATIDTLAVSPDGKIAVASSEGRLESALRTYDLATGRVLRTIDLGRNAGAVAVSPDGKTLAANLIYIVFMFDLNSGEETDRIPYPPEQPRLHGTGLLLFSPDGKRVVVAAADGKALLLMDRATGEVVRTFPHAYTAAISPDGKNLVTGAYLSEEKVFAARRWELGTGRELAPLPLGKGSIQSVTYSADGKIIALGSTDGNQVTVKLYDAATGKERLKIPFPDASTILSIVFSPDGKTLAASGGATIRLFDPATCKERVKIDRKAIGLHFLPDGATLVGAVSGTIYRWDVATGKSLIPEGGDSLVVQIAVTADGKRIVTRGQSGDAHVWDARTGKHQRRLSGSWERGFALSPDGRFLVWPVGDKAIQFKDADRPGVTHTGSRLRMIDVTDGMPVERFGGFEGDAYDLFFTAGGKTLVTVDHGRRDAGVKIWEVATGKIERSFPAAGEPGTQVWGSRLSPDGKVLAVTYYIQERNVGRLETKLWDVASAQEIDEPPPHWVNVEVMAFAPDGKTVAVATPDATIQFRDAVTGKVRDTFRGSPGRVTALAFGPDGQLFSGSLDATVLAWDLRAVKPPFERK